MSSITHILESKGHALWSVGPDDTVYDTLKLMAEKEVGALVVMQGEKLIGIISERDYARKVVLEGLSSQTTPVKDIMTTNVCCARPTQTIDECMALMTDKRIRHLPVVNGDTVIGILSIGDLVKTKIAEQQVVIEQLAHYISS